MAENYQAGDNKRTSARRSIRITFKVSEKKIEILSYQRLSMTCPPSVGPAPRKGENSGYWMELQDAKKQVLFFRLLDTPLGDSVTLHSPDGKIERKFSDVSENTFEVLFPDFPEAKGIVFMGESLEPMGLRIKNKTDRQASSELSRFEIPKGQSGRGK
jgi:hypothetical protein